MGLFDSILGAASGAQTSSGSGEANPLLGIVGGLLTQAGGLQGLAGKFSQSGHGDAFSSWVGMGENHPVSGDQIQEVLGSDQIRAIAARIGVDPALASNFMAEYLPKIIDKLTPTGKVEAGANTQQGLAACCHHSCKVSAENRAAISPRKPSTFLPKATRLATAKVASITGPVLVWMTVMPQAAAE